MASVWEGRVYVGSLLTCYASGVIRFDVDVRVTKTIELDPRRWLGNAVRYS